MGIGIGMIIATILMSLFNSNQMSAQEIQKQAYEQGMIYKNECKVITE